MKFSPSSVVALLTLLNLVSMTVARAASFQSVATNATAADISGNGAVVICNINGKPFRWSAQLSPLGEMTSVTLRGLSYDGTTVVGSYFDWFGNHPFRFPSSGVVGPAQDGNVYFDVSAEGNHVAGSRTPRGEYTKAMRDDVSLGSLSSDSYPTEYCTGISDDGSICAGTSESRGAAQAFRWTAGSGLVGLGYLGANQSSRADDISGNGAVIVGQSGVEAFRWSEGSGMAGLGDLPGGDFNSRALAASWDGAIIVGKSTSASGVEAFIWDAGNAMRSLKSVLQAAGLDL